MDGLEVTAALTQTDISKNTTYVLKTLLWAFAKHYNYSIKLLHFSRLRNLSSMDFMLVDSGSYADMQDNPYVLTSVVPFYSLTLVMPTMNKLEKSDYFTMPFDTAIWIVWALFPIYFACMLKVFLRSTSIEENMLEGVRVIATGIIRIRSNRTHIRIIYFLVIFLGFAFSITYTSFLGCFLTRPVDKSDYSFVCIKGRIKQLQLDGKREDLMVLSLDEYYVKLFDMDMKYGYCMTTLFWKANLGFQKYMKPIFRQIMPWKFSYGHMLRINRNSKHLTTFNKFILNAFSSGFMKKWQTDMLMIASIDKVRHYIVEDNTSLGLQDLLIPFMFCGCCLLMSMIVFILEICCFYFKKLKDII